MLSLFAPVIVAASLVCSQQAAPSQAALIGSLKPFEGHWKGSISMGTMKMDVDMTWKPFAGRWAEVSYTYSAGTIKLDYRVMMTPNSDNTGFNLWMFGNDMPVPDTMKGVIEGKVLNVVHVRENQPDVKFWIDDQKNMVMSIQKPDEKHTEIGRGLLKPVKD